MRSPTPLVLSLFLLATACSEPAPPVADGVSVVPGSTFELPAVPQEARTDRIELVEELVIGERGDDDNYLLSWSIDVVAVTDGRIFVLDAVNNRIQTFTADGEFVGSFGRAGEGPGELSTVWDFVLVGETLHVQQMTGFRRFGLDGQPQGDNTRADFAPLRVSIGLADGSIVGLDPVRIPRSPEAMEGGYLESQVRLVRVAGGGEELAELHVFEPQRRPLLWMSGGGGRSIPVPNVEASVAATRSGDIYGAATDAYDVHAYTIEGELRWRLQVPWQRSPITEDDIDVALSALRDDGFSADGGLRSRIWFPEQRPAIARLAVDGHDRLYVFLEPLTRAQAESGNLAVDVYDRGGARLFAGMIRNVSWDFVLGDHVYSVEPDPDTEESRVVRYRLDVPF